MNCARHVIVHYHLFKNGGSTFTAILRRNFGSDFAQIEAPPGQLSLSGSELMDTLRARQNLLAVSSHTLRRPLPLVKNICVHEIHLFRNPLDRLRSIHDFFRYKGDQSPLAESAKRLDLPSFLRLLISDHAYLSENAQLRMLLCEQNRRPTREDLQTSATILSRSACVGVIEDYDTAMAAMEFYLCKFFSKLDLSGLPRNVSTQRLQTLEERLTDLESQCGKTLYQELLALNELDNELVKLATLELKQRASQIPSFEAVRRQFARKQRIRAVTQHVLWKYDKGYRSVRRRILSLPSVVFGIDAIDGSF
jgi:hypothetical protein